MSLVKVLNSSEYVEMNELEYLCFEDGWNGGGWNNWDVVNKPNENNFYVVTDSDVVKVEARTYKIHGSDGDMGHTYYWTSTRLKLKVTSLIGDIEIDSNDLPQNCKLMYLRKVVL